MKRPKEAPHVCPDYCHVCPHMDGAVMPWCIGTAMGTTDEMSLSSCSCDPSDPMVAKWELGLLCRRLILLLRDARRFRQVEKWRVKRLMALTQFSETAQPNILREQCREIRQIVSYMQSGLEQPSEQQLQQHEATVLKFSQPARLGGQRT